MSFERLLDTLAEGSTNGREVSVFYLKYAKAPAVAETLGQIFGASAVVAQQPTAARRGRPTRGNSRTANTTTSTGSLASGADAHGALATGSILITPDERLNALLVRANQTDLDTIENLLKVLDQKDSPEEIAIASKARLIPVVNSNAEEIAEIVKQVYADRMVQAPSGGNPRQQMMLQMMMQRRGGRQGGGPGGAAPANDVPRISVGVDTRTNSLVVAAPDPLFEEVKQLVEQLDNAAAEQDNAVQVVTLHRTSPDAVEEALAGLVGEAVQFNRTNTQQGRSNNSRYGSQNRQNYRRPQSGQSGNRYRTSSGNNNRSRQSGNRSNRSYGR